jgi:hypothetical protein
VGGYPGVHPGPTFNDLHLDLQLAVLAHVPLADLARHATMCQVMRAGYKERLQEREACIEASLASGWPVEVTEGLSAADMAVPRDLIVSPPVRLLSLKYVLSYVMQSKQGQPMCPPYRPCLHD